ncbi:hypothetical protein [Nocardiopsis sp. ATB16-24]|uniref:hypothetical protein n=1 Tax=Nocardiopsis sp. ATB16-24 TaxID=3019555 RepID=UPI0025549457|nr:hypothetical protein [Nocardiopsis sp. ATB16-24]
MRWVTYLSPSGGGERVGVLDDGDVLGAPGNERLVDLLEAGGAALREAYGRAGDTPVEIIVEPEARMCAPVTPVSPVPVRAGEEVWRIGPELVRGADDAVPSGARTARLGVAAVAGGEGPASAYTPACLWLDGEGRPLQLNLGPVLTTAEEVAEGGLELSASVDEREVTRGTVDPAHEWLVSGPEGVRALLPVATPSLEADDELFVEADGLGSFEVRVGSQV